VETVRFIGHVFPREVTLNAELPDLDWAYQEENVTFSFSTKTNNPNINVEYFVKKSQDLFSESYKRAVVLTGTSVALPLLFQEKSLFVYFWPHSHEVLKRTWIMFDRFLEYLRRGGLPNLLSFFSRI
jgi:hypothetical protein